MEVDLEAGSISQIDIRWTEIMNMGEDEEEVDMEAIVLEDVEPDSEEEEGGTQKIVDFLEGAAADDMEEGTVEDVGLCHLIGIQIFGTQFIAFSRQKPRWQRTNPCGVTWTWEEICKVLILRKRWRSGGTSSI